MSKDDDFGAVVGAVLGFLGLAALAKILSERQCRWCGKYTPKNNPRCVHCGGFL